MTVSCFIKSEQIRPVCIKRTYWQESTRRQLRKQILGPASDFLLLCVSGNFLRHEWTLEISSDIPYLWCDGGKFQKQLEQLRHFPRLCYFTLLRKPLRIISIKKLAQPQNIINSDSFDTRGAGQSVKLGTGKRLHLFASTKERNFARLYKSLHREKRFKMSLLQVKIFLFFMLENFNDGCVTIGDS